MPACNLQLSKGDWVVKRDCMVRYSRVGRFRFWHFACPERGFFMSNTAPEATTGEIEENYHMVCEEYEEKKRGHTQFWKYLKKLNDLDFVAMEMHSSSQGRTQLIRLDKIPAETLEAKVVELL